MTQPNRGVLYLESPLIVNFHKRFCISLCTVLRTPGTPKTLKSGLCICGKTNLL